MLKSVAITLRWSNYCALCCFALKNAAELNYISIILYLHGGMGHDRHIILQAFVG